MYLESIVSETANVSAEPGTNQGTQNNSHQTKGETKINQNSDCITRDAKNVFDKKRLRYEKIQKMRENSQNETNMAYDESLNI